MRTAGHRSLVGIAFGDGVLAVARLRRNGGDPQLTHLLSVPLSLDLQADAPELVGAEIAQQLRQAGFHGRACVVCVPVPWTHCLRVDLPDLPETEIRDFLLTQAERELLIGPDDLALALARYHTADGGNGAAVFAVQATHLTRLQHILKAARLRPVAFTVGVTALAAPNPAECRPGIALLLTPAGADLAIAGPGAFVALRHVPLVADGGSPPDLASLVRQLRISCGQLPTPLRRLVHELQVFADPQLSAAFLQEANPALAVLSITARPTNLEVRAEVRHESLGERGRPLEAAAAAAARQLLAYGTPALGLDLPRRDTLRTLWRKRAVRLLLWLAGTTAAAAVLVLALVLQQKLHLARLTAEWTAIEPRVQSIQRLRDRVRELHPWLGAEPNALRILRVLAEAFPEDGVVWATDLKIKGLSEVSLSGRSTDRQAWFAMQERLRRTAGVRDLRLSQSRENAEGSEPMTFSLTFRWQPGGGNGAQE